MSAANGTDRHPGRNRIGGKKMDMVFALCGARRIGNRLKVDASSQPLPDEEALTWVEGWKALV
jgi:MioC protein